ncbi:MAG: sulfite oxidase-like oxidoreductase [Planctomycetes bacterium]|nr:sulfite oxidase-like oxidoreductase [Planctomycetota bacterium]
MSNAIVSPDTQRADRIPPRQSLTTKWPVLHYGPTPSFDRSAWTFHIFGLVETPWQCAYDAFIAMPTVTVHADMHCVTRWSKLDNRLEGVAARTVLANVNVKPRAKFVMVHGEHGFTANLPLDDFLGDDCLFAWKHNGHDLDADHGYPLRLVVPRLYAWKSAKWVRGIELLADDRPGFWEEWDHGGYHMRGDPWKEERFRDDSER